MSESVAKVAAPTRVDPVPLLRWVGRRFAAAFEVVAVLPDDGEHDAAGTMLQVTRSPLTRTTAKRITS